jgi:hypothetical protein
MIKGAAASIFITPAIQIIRDVLQKCLAVFSFPSTASCNRFMIAFLSSLGQPFQSMFRNSH